MVNFTALKASLVAALLAGAALTAAPQAEARTFVAVGVGVPLGYYDPYWYPPPPVVYAPPPVYYAPPVVVQQPAPTYVAPQAQSWYYCDNPQGYYPYVANCGSGWRQVPAQPQPAH
jgi:hypothetical protein